MRFLRAVFVAYFCTGLQMCGYDNGQLLALLHYRYLRRQMGI